MGKYVNAVIASDEHITFLSIYSFHAALLAFLQAVASKIATGVVLDSHAKCRCVLVMPMTTASYPFHRHFIPAAQLGLATNLADASVVSCAPHSGSEGTNKPHSEATRLRCRSNPA